MVEFAGLSHRVKVIHGSVGTSEAIFGSNGLGMKEMLRDRGSDTRAQRDIGSDCRDIKGENLRSDSRFQGVPGSDFFDIVFIDHDKARYLEDLKIIEACGMLKSGVTSFFPLILSNYNRFSSPSSVISVLLLSLHRHCSCDHSFWYLTFTN